MSSQLAYLMATAVASGYKCSLLRLHEKIVINFSIVCNGSGTGDVQALGSNNISSVKVSSVKCYAN
ncbi:hypothetical protein N7451_004068 [Penicillium sp. IBT 35674x]|nr:hypothetical protein N7451_004068 [Penicillium sp. IBT 35674x]